MNTYIDISNFQLARSLSENYEQIKIDFNGLKNFLGSKTQNVMGPTQKESNGKILYEGQFQSVFTRIAEEACSPPEIKSIFGTTEESRAAAMERFNIKRSITSALEKCLEPYIDYVGCVGFNIIHPGSKLNMHYGMCNDYVRIHMGITCDPGAVFYLEKLPPRAWVPGELFAFDDGLAFHGTEHKGVTPRCILLLDIKKTAFDELKEEKWP